MGFPLDIFVGPTAAIPVELFRSTCEILGLVPIAGVWPLHALLRYFVMSFCDYVRQIISLQSPFQNDC